MKLHFLFTYLILFPLYALSNPEEEYQIISLSENPVMENTQAVSFSNESEIQQNIKSYTRSIEFPTQIIRMNRDVTNQQISCQQVHEEINKVLVENIANNQFSYSIFISCHYNPDNFFATEFTINSYFDPVNDEAISYLKLYLSQYNGSNLLGTPLKIESAKGLIISLSIAAGMKKKPNKPPFNEYRRDRSNFYFKSNYEMKNKLFTDILENFYSNNAEKIIPFIDRWVFNNAGSLYKSILRDSNYMELQPERIFVMENGEEIFISGLKQYFIHHCEKYDNHHCLKAT